MTAEGAAAVSGQDGGAAERLAAYLRFALPRDDVRSMLYGPRRVLDDLRAVIDELSRLREERDAAHRDGWASAMETVAEEGRRECEDVARLEARLDAVHRLCDAQGEDSYVMVSALRAVLSSSGGAEAEVAP